MQNKPDQQVIQPRIDPTLHEQLVAARAARSIVVTDDTPRNEIADEYLVLDPERWDGMA